MTPSDTVTTPVDGGRLRAIAILSASSLTLFALAAVAPSLPAIERAYADVPDAALLTRMVLTIAALFIALSAPVSGVLVDRIGRKPVLLGALVLYLFSGTAGIWLEGLNEIILSRAILGIAAGMILTSATTLIGDFYRGDARNRMAGIQVAVMVLAVASGTTVAGYLADTNWRLPFYLYALALPIIPLVTFGIREPVRRPRAVRDPDVPALSYGPAVLRAGVVYLIIWLTMVSTFVIPSQAPFLLPEIGIPVGFCGGYRDCGVQRGRCGNSDILPAPADPVRQQYYSGWFLPVSGRGSFAGCDGGWCAPGHTGNGVCWGRVRAVDADPFCLVALHCTA